jgi:hypothetical protein
VPDWEQGKALEHLVVRAFKLSGLEAEYPYDVPPTGRPFEQIDGIAYLDNLGFLIECKDTRREDVTIIAKLRAQLDRRPSTVFGMIFMTGAFTLPAMQLAAMLTPFRLLIWQFKDIDGALAAKDFKHTLREKYRKLCRYGLMDWPPCWQSLNIDGGSP